MTELVLKKIALEKENDYLVLDDAWPDYDPCPLTNGAALGLDNYRTRTAAFEITGSLCRTASEMIKPRCSCANGLPVTIKPPFENFANAVTARSISSGSRTLSLRNPS